MSLTANLFFFRITCLPEIWMKIRNFYSEEQLQTGCLNFNDWYIHTRSSHNQFTSIPSVLTPMHKENIKLFSSYLEKTSCNFIIFYFWYKNKKKVKHKFFHQNFLISWNFKSNLMLLLTKLIELMQRL